MRSKTMVKNTLGTKQVSNLNRWIRSNNLDILTTHLNGNFIAEVPNELLSLYSRKVKELYIEK